MPTIYDERPPSVIEIPEAPINIGISKRKKQLVPTLTKGELEMGKLQTSSRLMEMICRMENLNEAFLDVRQSRGCAGSDGVSIAAFDRKRVEQLTILQKELVNGKYRPKILKVFEITKSDGSTRTLKVPSVRDRVAQQAVLRIINSVWEAEFEPTSFAYRKGRSVRQAIKRVEQYREEGCLWVLRADVDNYFDEIPRQNLLERFEQRIRDDQVVSLVKNWIEVGSTKIEPTTGRGIPQGLSVSPLLSNIYLDRFDEAIDGLGYKMVRYADDFLIACRDEKEAQDALSDVERELKFDRLSLHDKKTYITSFAKGFSFLGYIFIGSFSFQKSKLPDGWHISGAGGIVQDNE